MVGGEWSLGALANTDGRKRTDDSMLCLYANVYTSLLLPIFLAMKKKNQESSPTQPVSLSIN